MQTRTIVGVAGVLGVGALAMTQMGFQSQDRQYKKTLAYMHDGRDQFNKKMSNIGVSTGGELVEGKKLSIKEEREGKKA